MTFSEAVLAAVALVVGVLNAVVGPTGGAMAGATSAVVPPPASLLLHAAVSWWSSLVRVLVLRRLIIWRIVLRMAVVSTPPLVVVLLASSRLSAPAWKVGIAAYLTLWVFLPGLRAALSRPRAAAAASVVAGVASAAIGAGGALVFPTMLVETESIDAAIASEATLTLLQNTVKILLLTAFLGISLSDYWRAAALMMLASSIGLLVGRKASTALPESVRSLLNRVALLGVAAWLTVSALV